MEGSPLHDPVQHQNTPTARHRVVWWALASECGVARFRAPHVKPEIIRSISGHHTEQLRELVLDLPLAGEARRYRRGHRSRDGAQSRWRGTRRVRRRGGRRRLGRGGRVGVGAAARRGHGCPLACVRIHGWLRKSTQLSTGESIAVHSETTCSQSTDRYIAAGRTHVPIGTLVGTPLDSGTLFGLATRRQLRET